MLSRHEAADAQYVGAVAGRDWAEPVQGRLGVSQLRAFLEEMLRDRHLAALQQVLPQLQHAATALAKQLEQVGPSSAHTPWIAAIRIPVTLRPRPALPVLASRRTMRSTPSPVSACSAC